MGSGIQKHSECGDDNYVHPNFIKVKVKHIVAGEIFAALALVPGQRDGERPRPESITLRAIHHTISCIKLLALARRKPCH